MFGQLRFMNPESMQESVPAILFGYLEVAYRFKN